MKPRPNKDQPYHQTAPKSPLIQPHPKPPLVKERNVRHNNGPKRLSRRRTNPAKNSRSQERVVRRRSGAPDARSRGDQRGDDGDRPSTQTSRKRDPDEVCETEDEDGHADEVDDFGESRVEGLHVVWDLGGEG